MEVIAISETALITVFIGILMAMMAFAELVLKIVDRAGRSK
jgi:hypothetical protein